MRTRLLIASFAVMLWAAHAIGQQANFSSESQVVVLHVAVLDKKAYVSGLDQTAFHVFENKQPQPIAFFSSQDAPVTVGLVIDSSASMGANRDRVIAAAVAFAQNSNPADDIFALGFNENVQPALPDGTPFTRDIPTLRAALDKAIGSRGMSAVYQAIDAGLDYLDKGSYERKVLVLVSDGGDNASSITRAQILARAQASNAMIYTVGLVDPLETEADPGFLRQLADASGGQSFEPHSVTEVAKALQQVAHDIRNVYTVGYVPPEATRLRSANQKEELRRVSVEVRLPDGRKAAVRTRRAYLPGEESESSTDAAGR